MSILYLLCLIKALIILDVGQKEPYKVKECKLTILVTSDIHGNIYPIHYRTNEYADLGLAKIATVIKKMKQKERHILLIDNGDLIQGSPLTDYYVKYCPEKENPMIKVLNFLNYDCAVIGNHEFNYGFPILKKAVRESRFPWLSANILNAQTGKPYFGKPYIVKTFGSLKVAILGLTTSYIPNWENPNHIQSLLFEDVIESARKWVSFIREHEQPYCLIVSYQGGFERHFDTGELMEKETGENVGYKLCMEIQGIDCLITGHQHRQIENVVVNQTIVVQPGFNGQALGKVTITFVQQDEKWKIVNKQSEILRLNEVCEDKEIIQLCYEYEKATQEWLDQPIGKIDGDMSIQDPFQVRIQDHPFIEFINKVQMDAANAEISSTALFHNEAKGFYGDVTMRDIVSNYVYPNTLVVLKVTGKDIKDALERSASYFTLNDQHELTVNPEFSTPKPQHYNYDMWEGIEYVIDVRKPFGERIVQLTHKGKPLEDDQYYHVVMNHYRAGGGGDYFMFKDKKIVKEIPIDMAQLIANYFRKHSVVKATCDHNWKIIY